MTPKLAIALGLAACGASALPARQVLAIMSLPRVGVDPGRRALDMSQAARGQFKDLESWQMRRAATELVTFTSCKWGDEGKVCRRVRRFFFWGCLYSYENTYDEVTDTLHQLYAQAKQAVRAKPVTFESVGEKAKGVYWSYMQVKACEATAPEFVPCHLGQLVVYAAAAEVSSLWKDCSAPAVTNSMVTFSKNVAKGFYFGDYASDAIEFYVVQSGGPEAFAESNFDTSASFHPFDQGVDGGSPAYDCPPDLSACSPTNNGEGFDLGPLRFGQGSRPGDAAPEPILSAGGADGSAWLGGAGSLPFGGLGPDLFAAALSSGNGPVVLAARGPGASSGPGSHCPVLYVACIGGQINGVDSFYDQGSRADAAALYQPSYGSFAGGADGSAWLGGAGSLPFGGPDLFAAALSSGNGPDELYELYELPKMSLFVDEDALCPTQDYSRCEGDAYAAPCIACAGTNDGPPDGDGDDFCKKAQPAAWRFCIKKTNPDGDDDGEETCWQSTGGLCGGQGPDVIMSDSEQTTYQMSGYNPDTMADLHVLGTHITLGQLHSGEHSLDDVREVRQKHAVNFVNFCRGFQSARYPNDQTYGGIFKSFKTFIENQDKSAAGRQGYASLQTATTSFQEEMTKPGGHFDNVVAKLELSMLGPDGTVEVQYYRSYLGGIEISAWKEVSGERINTDGTKYPASYEWANQEMININFQTRCVQITHDFVEQIPRLRLQPAVDGFCEACDVAFGWLANPETVPWIGDNAPCPTYVSFPVNADLTINPSYGCDPSTNHFEPFVSQNQAGIEMGRRRLEVDPGGGHAVTYHAGTPFLSHRPASGEVINGCNIKVDGVKLPCFMYREKACSLAENIYAYAKGMVKNAKLRTVLWNQENVGHMEHPRECTLDPPFVVRSMRKQRGRCSSYGVPYVFKRGSPQAPSLERVDDNRWYNEKNVVITIVGAQNGLPLPGNKLIGVVPDYIWGTDGVERVEVLPDLPCPGQHDPELANWRLGRDVPLGFPDVPAPWAPLQLRALQRKWTADVAGTPPPMPVTTRPAVAASSLAPLEQAVAATGAVLTVATDELAGARAADATAVLAAQERARAVATTQRELYSLQAQLAQQLDELTESRLDQEETSAAVEAKQTVVDERQTEHDAAVAARDAAVKAAKAKADAKAKQKAEAKRVQKRKREGVQDITTFFRKKEPNDDA